MSHLGRWLWFAVALLSACANAPVPPQAAIADLAPAGKLRAAINFGNPILATKDAATGAPRGVSVDLANELARRLEISKQPLANLEAFERHAKIRSIRLPAPFGLLGASLPVVVGAE